MDVKFKHWHCYLKFGQYENGRTAIQLKEKATHQPIATATVNVPDFDLPDGLVIIKNWSENKGMTQSLIDAGIINEPVGIVQCGHAAGHICELLINPKEAN